MDDLRNNGLKHKLRELREKNGFTQELVAEKLKVTRSTYTYYETGKTNPSLENLRILAKLYNISIEDLLDNESESFTLNDSNSKFNDTSHIPTNAASLTNEEKQLLASFRIASPKEKRKAINILNSFENPKK